MGEKRGRKPWIPTKEILDQVEGMAGRFLKEDQIHTLLGISHETWAVKKKEYPELSESIRRGRAKVAVNISNKLYELATQGKGNIHALIFLAKSVVGLKENDPQVQESVTFNVYTSKGRESLQFSDS